MKKLKKILIIAAVCVLVLTGTFLVVLYTVGDRIINEVIDQEIAQLEQNLDKKAATAGDQETMGDVDSSPASVENSEGKTAGQEKSGSNNVKTSTAKSGTQSKANTQPQKNTNPAISIDEINNIRSNISAVDKVTAATLVLKRLNSSDISMLQGMLNGGLSNEDKEKAKKLAYSRFSSGEIAQIKELYHKYMK